MTITENITKQITEVKNIFNEFNLSLEVDDFIFDEREISILERNKNNFSKLKEIDFNNLIMDIILNNVNPKILNSLVKTFEEYNLNFKSKYSKIRNFDRDRLFKNFLEYRYLDKISILENDIKEIKDNTNKMPDWLKDKECDYFKNEIEKINSEFEIGKEAFLWIKKDYYTLAFQASSEMEKEIQKSFSKQQALETEEDIFSLEYVLDFRKMLINNDIIDVEKLTKENLYRILNQREPLSDCSECVKIKTSINFPLNELSKKVKKKGLDKEKWINHVYKILNLNKNSITSHGYKNEKNEIFYDFFGIKKE